MKRILMISFLISACLLGSPTRRIVEVAQGNENWSISRTSKSGSPYLFVWAGDSDKKDSDFLAVIDARSSEPTYGQVIATLPVNAHGTYPHHTEYEFPVGSILFANGWGAGRTFLLDLGNPTKPRLAGQFTYAKEYGFPHSYARLPNGNVLATFQVKKKSHEPPGALVELTEKGRVVRATSADAAGLDKKSLWPYSLAVLPQIDRVVSTTTEMGLPEWAQPGSHNPGHKHTLSDSNHLQIWSLSDLRLLATIPLPPSPTGSVHLNPAEPRVLGNGSVMVNTFNCGLYRVLGLDTSDPKAEFVYSFPAAAKPGFECGVPVVFGNFWIQTDPSLPGLIALDVSDSAKPVEVSRLVFDSRFEKVHWVAADRKGSRLVVTGNNLSWVLIVDIQSETGALRLDEKFRDKGSDHPGVDFNRPNWPHGSTGNAFVHGALFGPH